MPLIAKRRSTGERIDITTIDEPRMELHPGECICPFCNGDLFIRSAHSRAGNQVVSHFVHYSRCDSEFEGQPESILHMDLKAWLRSTLKAIYPEGTSIELEIPIPMNWRAKGRIADLIVYWPTGWKEIHEIQLAGLTISDLEDRTDDYKRAGYDVRWWLGKAAKTDANIKWLLENFGRADLLDFFEEKIQRSYQLGA